MSEKIKQDIAERLARCTIRVAAQDRLVPRQDVVGTGQPASTAPCGPPATSEGTESKPPRQFEVTTHEQLLQALGASPSVANLGGRTIDIAEGCLQINAADVTIINGTLKCLKLGVEASAANFCCRDVTFLGGGAATRARDVDLKGVKRCNPMVMVTGAQDVVFEKCVFRDADNRNLSRQLFGPGVAVATHGLHVAEAATVRVTDCRFTNNVGVGLNAAGPGTAVRVEGTTFKGNAMTGALSEIEATLTVEGCVCVGNRLEGLYAARRGTLVARDTCCRDSMVGAMAEQAGVLVLDRCKMAGNSQGAIGVADQGSTATIRDLQSKGMATYGVGAHEGGTCDVRGCRLEDCTMGFSAIGAGSRVTAAGAVVRGGMMSVMAAEGCAIALTDATLEGATAVGATAGGAGSSVTLTDVRVISCGKDGVSVVDGARGTLQRTTVTDSRATGVAVAGHGSRVDAVDIDAKRCGFSGVGARDGGKASVKRGTLSNNGAFGASAMGTGSAVTLADVECDGNGKAGVAAVGEGSIVARGGTLRGNAQFAAMSGGESTRVVLKDVRMTLAAGSQRTTATDGGKVVER